MKHIKQFSAMNSLLESNESLSFKDDVQDFCESNLTYLLDEGMKIIVDDSDLARSGITFRALSVTLSFHKMTARGGMKWDNIKDYIIPFLIRLSSDYNIYSTRYYDPSYELEFNKKPKNEPVFCKCYASVKDVINEREKVLETGIIKDIKFYIISSGIANYLRVRELIR